MSDDPVSVPPPALIDSSRRSGRGGDALPVYKELPQQPSSPPDRPTLDSLRDVELDVRIEIGRVRMRIEDVLKLGEGSVVELDRPAGAPVDVYVSDRLVARGEVVVLDERFAVRVTQVISPIEDD